MIFNLYIFLLLHLPIGSLCEEINVLNYVLLFNSVTRTGW